MKVLKNIFGDMKFPEMEFSIINQPFFGYPHFRKPMETPICLFMSSSSGTCPLFFIHRHTWDSDATLQLRQPKEDLEVVPATCNTAPCNKL